MMAEIRLTIPETADIAEISASQLRRWLRQFDERSPSGTIIPYDKESDGRGDDALLSHFTAMQLFVAGRLVEVGVAVPNALEAGRRFAHVGDEHRMPSQEFGRGETWLLVAAARSRIVNVVGQPEAGQHASLGDAVAAFKGHLLSYANDESFTRAVVVLNLTGASGIVGRRIESVLGTKRPRNTRLR